MIADLLSASRIILGILFILLARNRYVVLGVVIIAGLTDILDGMVSRKYGKSKYGYLIDPIADKFFVLIVMLGLILYYNLDILYAVLILSRDIMNGIILPILYSFKKFKEIPEAKFLGKLTTVFLFITIGLIILDFYSYEAIFITMGLSIFTAIYSLIFNFPKT